MFAKASALALIPFMTFPASAAGPSTPQEWQQMYDACVEGTQAVSQKMGLGPGYAPAFCACVRENLQKTAETERDAEFRAIQNRCMQSAKAASDANDWPQAGISNFQADCYKQPPSNVPRRSLKAFCTCYVQYVPRNVPWREWLLLDLAIKTKGALSLDSRETAIMARVLTVGAYCSEKIVSQ